MKISGITTLVVILLSVSVLQARRPGIREEQLHREVDSLTTLAYGFLNSSFSKATLHSQKANQLAINIGYPEGIVESSLVMAILQANTNRCAEAIHSLSTLQINNTVSVAKINAVKGLCYYYLGEYDSARVFYNLAIDVFEKHTEEQWLGMTCNRLAKVFLQTGETKNAGLYNEKARVLFEKLNSFEGKAWTQDVKGEVLQAQRLYDEALSAHHSAYMLFTKSGHLAGKSAAALHKGNSFYMLVMDDSSKKYFNEALSGYRTLGDSNGIAICYSNLSRVALEESNYDLAIAYAENTLATIKDGGYKRIEAATFQQLGDIFAELKQYNEAIRNIHKALTISREINHKVKIMDCYKSLSEIYSAQNNPDLSYDYLLKAYRLKDSIQPIAFSSQLAEMQYQIETHKQDVQIQLLEQKNTIKSLEIENQKSELRKRNLFIISVIIIFIMFMILVYFRIQKQKLKSLLEKKLVVKSTEENERIRFAKDIHDDLGSGLSKIGFLSEMIVRNYHKDDAARQNAAAISETAKGLIDNMRDLIWALNNENTTICNLLAGIREYASDYLEDYPADLVLNFPDTVIDVKITKECHREIMMTIKEALNNIVKHANATIISIVITVSDSSFCIVVSDDGCGIASGNLSNGNGLHNMKNRITATGGVLEFETGPQAGTAIMISVPVSGMTLV